MTVRQADNWEADKAVLLDFAGLLRARHRALLPLWLQWGDKLVAQDPDALADLEDASDALKRGETPDPATLRTVEARAFHELWQETNGSPAHPWQDSGASVTCRGMTL